MHADWLSDWNSMRQINLVHHRIQKSPQLAKVNNLVYYRLVPLSALSLFIVGIGIAINIFFTATIDQKTAEQETVRTSFKTFETREKKLRILKRRTNEIGKNTSSEFAINAVLKDIMGNLTVSGVRFSSIQINDKKQVAVTVVAADSNSAAAFSSAVDRMSSQNLIQEPKLSTLSLHRESGNFGMEVSFVMQ